MEWVTGERGSPRAPVPVFFTPSAVKPVFATLEQALIIRQLGALAPTDRETLRKAIAQTLG